MKKLKWWHWVLIFIAICWAITKCVQSMIPQEMKAEMAKEEAKSDSLRLVNEKIDSTNKAQEDDLIMALVKSERILKENLKDPDSYDKISEKKFIVTDDKKIYIQVLIKYRAKNSFGGMNISEQAFNFDKSLNLIESYEVK